MEVTMMMIDETRGVLDEPNRTCETESCSSQNIRDWVNFSQKVGEMTLFMKFSSESPSQPRAREKQQTEIWNWEDLGSFWRASWWCSLSRRLPPRLTAPSPLSLATHISRPCWRQEGPRRSSRLPTFSSTFVFPDFRCRLPAACMLPSSWSWTWRESSLQPPRPSFPHHWG